MNSASAPSRAERALGPALERHYQYLLWLIPTLEKMPRSQKFLLGDQMQRQALQVLDELVWDITCGMPACYRAVLGAAG